MPLFRAFAKVDLMEAARYQPATEFLRKETRTARLRDLYDPQGYDVDDPRLIAMSKAYESWLKEASLPPVKGDGQLRPILFDAGGPMRSFSNRALLVGESIALCQLDISTGLEGFWTRMLELEDLIDRELVTLVSEQAIFRDFNEVQAIVGRNGELLKGTLRITGKEAKGWPGIMDSLFQAFECLGTLDACARFPERFDLVSRNRSHTKAYRFLIESSLGRYSDSYRSHDELSYFPEVLTLPLPRINLSLRDMVRVRDDGLFDEWRSAFSKSLVELRDPSSTLLGVNAMMVRDLKQELIAASERLTETLNKRPSLRRAIAGSAGLSVACVTGSLAAGAGPAASATLGGVTYVAGAVTQWLGNRPTRGARAFKRLIVQLFDE